MRRTDVTPVEAVVASTGNLPLAAERVGCADEYDLIITLMRNGQLRQVTEGLMMVGALKTLNTMMQIQIVLESKLDELSVGQAAHHYASLANVLSQIVAIANATRTEVVSPEGRMESIRDILTKGNSPPTFRNGQRKLVALDSGNSGP